MLDLVKQAVVTKLLLTDLRFTIYPSWRLLVRSYPVWQTDVEGWLRRWPLIVIISSVHSLKCPNKKQPKKVPYYTLYSHAMLLTYWSEQRLLTPIASQNNKPREFSLEIFIQPFAKDDNNEELYICCWGTGSDFHFFSLLVFFIYIFFQYHHL